MKKRWVLLSLLCVLVVAGVGGTLLGAGATTVAFKGQDGPLRRLIVGQIGRLMTLGSALNLTSDQKFQIREIVASHRTEIAAVVRPLIEKRRALRAATSSATLDEPAIRAATADLTQSLGDAAVLAARIKLQVRSIMTPRQTQQIDEFRKQSDSAVDQFVQELGNS